jgi:tetratricopeptide (TPR) repeat protein
MKRLLILTLLCCFALPLFGQQPQRWQWPDKLKNSSVLSKSITPPELRQTMQGFTRSLGVRCTHCHVGEEGQDFSTYDFPSDARPAKNKARTMIKMMDEINGKFLSEVSSNLGGSAKVGCVNCHRGIPAPITLDERLKMTYDAAGLDSTVRHYKLLREQYYGGASYDFKEGALIRLGDKILTDSTKASDAVAVIKMNIELYPNFAFSYVHLASWYEIWKQIPTAIEYYQKAVAVAPNNEQIKRQLDRLQALKK